MQRETAECCVYVYVYVPNLLIRAMWDLDVVFGQGSHVLRQKAEATQFTAQYMSMSTSTSMSMSVHQDTRREDTTKEVADSQIEVKGVIR